MSRDPAPAREVADIGRGAAEYAGRLSGVHEVIGRNVARILLRIKFSYVRASVLLRSRKFLDTTTQSPDDIGEAGRGAAARRQRLERIEDKLRLGRVQQHAADPLDHDDGGLSSAARASARN